jgi:glycosyltransferase involved in cell wall biosynthesis
MVTSWAKKLQADLIHSPATLGTARRSVPSVVTMHDMLYWSHPELMSTGRYTAPVKWMERRASRAATRIMTISDVSRGEIVKFLRFDPARLDVVPLAGTPTPHAERVEHGGKGAFVLATGNRRPHKNWAGLIRALPYVDEAVRPRLIITGSHGDDPLVPVVQETGMGDWVELKSWVSAEEMSALYAEAAVMAMPSFCDGFSLPALEAMMAGLPVMLSDIPVYREVGGEAALYFDPTDPESIAASMTTAVTDPTLMARLTLLGYEQSAKFSWERTADGTLETFRAALA